MKKKKKMKNKKRRRRRRRKRRRRRRRRRRKRRVGKGCIIKSSAFSPLTAKQYPKVILGNNYYSKHLWGLVATVRKVISTGFYPRIFRSITFQRYSMRCKSGLVKMQAID